jgi:periplasmic protein CpxP/Spy
MNSASKNKMLISLVVLLLIANTATIAYFWINRSKEPGNPKERPNEYLVRELKFDSSQQEQLEALVKKHRETVERLRQQVRSAKDSFFSLVHEPLANDSVKKAAAASVSRITEQIDLITLDHFQQIRKICNTEQQKRFDEIIQEVIRRMGTARPPRDQHGPPHGEDRPGEPPPPGPPGE